MKYMKYINGLTNEYEIDHLNPEAKKVAKIIRDLLIHRAKRQNEALQEAGLEPDFGYSAHMGSGHVFHDSSSKLGWGGGTEILTVIHEGCDHDNFFSMDKCYDSACMVADFTGRFPKNCYADFEAMMDELSKHGYLCETVNRAVSCVYKD